MCRLLGYLGASIPLERLLYQPEHSLVVQSYQPREMTAGLLNADGFGVGWYDKQRQQNPFTYRNVLPIWNDVNLPGLSRYIESGCFLASVRSATPGLAVDLSNCPPFQSDALLAVHNGYIENFRHTLFRAIRDRLDETSHQFIQGTTDSEHIMALLLSEWRCHPTLSLEQVVSKTLLLLFELGQTHQVIVGANLILSDGQRLVACRAANRQPAPSLYCLWDEPSLPDAVVIASEPLFPGNWKAVPEGNIVSVEADLTLQIQPF